MQTQAETFSVEHSTPIKTSKRDHIKKWFHSFYDKDTDGISDSNEPIDYIDVSFESENEEAVTVTKKHLHKELCPNRVLKDIKRNINKLKPKNSLSNTSSNRNYQNSEIENYIKNMKEPSTCFDLYHTNPKDLNELFDHSMRRVFSGNILNESTIFNNYSSEISCEPFQNLNYDDLKRENNNTNEYKHLRFVSLDETMLKNSEKAKVKLGTSDSINNDSSEQNKPDVVEIDEDPTDQISVEHIEYTHYETEDNSIMETPSEYIPQKNTIHEVDYDGEITFNDTDQIQLESIPSENDSQWSTDDQEDVIVDKFIKSVYYNFTDEVEVKISNAAKLCSYDSRNDTLTIKGLKSDNTNQAAPRNIQFSTKKQLDGLYSLTPNVGEEPKWDNVLNEELDYYEYKRYRNVSDRNNIKEAQFITTYFPTDCY